MEHTALKPVLEHAACFSPCRVASGRRIALRVSRKNAVQRCRKSARIGPKCSAAVQEAPSSAALQLDDDLKNSVAVLETSDANGSGDKTTCYILGMSHVSQNSCDQIEELIKTVEPDVVLVELCKDRVGLLVDRETEGTQTWQARTVTLTGATLSDVWPSENEILSVCKTAKGRPIQVQDIEEDVMKLLGTGLFSRGKPIFGRAEEDEAPAFMPRVKGDDLQVQSVPPLGLVEFQVRDRALPPIISIEVRVDSSLMELGFHQEELEALSNEALESSKEGTRSLTIYLTLRKKLLDMCQEKGPADAVVIFRGEEKGRTEVVVRARRSNDPEFVTGFEQGAEGGLGWGIESFRPAKRPYKLSEGMAIPQAALDRLMGNDPNSRTDNSTVDVLREKLRISKSEFREWSDNETPIVITGEDAGKGPADYFGTFITSIYAKFQSDAGRKCGVDPGAAWRSAMTASVEKGVKQLLLADLPSSVSQRHLASSIFIGMGGRIALAVAITATIITLYSSGLIPDDLDQKVKIGAVLANVAVLWPIFGPYLEIARLAGMSSDEIEEAVKVKEPIQANLDTTLKLFGEDSLLDWPGAMKPIIDERDKYMARNLHAAAKGLPCSSPAFVQDVMEDNVVLRYMMPKDGPRKAAPMGKGDGEYAPIRGPKSIVAVVGSAHVRGMCKEWERLEMLGSQGVDEFLY